MLQYDRKQLGKFLAEHRINANKTQAEVAEILGYSSAQFISNIERGVTVAPLETIAKMIKLYKCSPDKVVHILISSQMDLLLKSFRKKA